MGPSYSGILGPLAFVTMLARGIISGSSPDDLVFSAVVCLIAFAAIGYVTGILAERIVLESVKQRFDLELTNQKSQQIKQQTA